MKLRKKVTIVQRVLPHYRISFFEQLFDDLEKRNIALQLVYGQEYPGTIPISFDLDSTWTNRIDNKYIRISRSAVIWQPCTNILNGPDLIIIEHSSRLLLNYLLILRILEKKCRLAYWGHGRNMQAAGTKRFVEFTKQWTAAKVDWWFAYTQLSADFLAEIGFPVDRITVVQNSIDTKVLAAAIQDTDNTNVRIQKERLGISGDNICVFCGSMYADKWLDFLLNACQKIREKIPNFHMLFIGSGPEEGKIEKAAREFSWIHHLGAVYGEDRAPYFAMSRASLMPGAVGLGIIDSFVAGTPLFTTEDSRHGPEIRYLNNGVNGIMTAKTEDAFASAIVVYLESGELQIKLGRGCSASAKTFTLENMVRNFAAGIELALSN